MKTWKCKTWKKWKYKTWKHESTTHENIKVRDMKTWKYETWKKCKYKTRHENMKVRDMKTWKCKTWKKCKYKTRHENMKVRDIKTWKYETWKHESTRHEVPKFVFQTFQVVSKGNNAKYVVSFRISNNIWFRTDLMQLKQLRKLFSIIFNFELFGSTIATSYLYGRPSRNFTSVTSWGC